MRGIGIIQPKVVFGTRECLREFDDVADVFGGDGGVGGGVAERWIIIQPVDHPILAQIARNVDYQFCTRMKLKEKHNKSLVEVKKKIFK